MRFKQKDISKLQQAINQAKTITIVTHFNPDGDAVGASCALYHFLNDMNKDVHVIIPNSVPEGLSFVLDNVRFTIAEKNFQVSKKRLLTTDLLFILDMSANHRSGEALEKVLDALNVNTVIIDHHINAADFGLSFSYPQASSTCEVVWNILYRLTNKKIFSKQISTLLYAGILNDTGSLSYSCNRPELYTVIANLLKSGIKANKIHQKIFDNYSYNRLKLLGFAISKKMKVFPEKHAAFIAISNSELKHYKYQPGDLEGVVNYCLKLENVHFCALLSERDNKIRMSFRSKDESIDVNKFAAKYWNGGGHKMASGGKSFESLDEVIKKLTLQIENNEFIVK